MICFKCGKRESPYGERVECDEDGICILKEKRENNAQILNFVVAGIVGSGKTYYLISLIQQLLSNPVKKTLKSIDMHFSFYNSAGIERNNSEDVFENLETYIRENQLLEGTTEDEWLHPIIIKLISGGPGKRKVTLITFFNFSGEFFESKDSIAKPAIIHANAFIIMVDPTKDSGIIEHLIDKDKYFDITNENLSILANIPKVIVQKSKTNSNSLSIPAAICVSKFDLLEHLIPQSLSTDVYLEHVDLFSKRGALNKKNITKTSRELNAFFDEIASDSRYGFSNDDIREYYQRSEVFAIASIGHEDIIGHGTPNPTLASDLTPKGVLAPFFWLLGVHGII